MRERERGGQRERERVRERERRERAVYPPRIKMYISKMTLQ